MVVFDTSVLAIAFDGNATVPHDPDTNKPVEKCRERINHLIEELSKSKTRILIPAPVLAEYLVHAGDDKDTRLQEIASSNVFSVSPFDTRAAVECSLIEDGDKGAKAQLDEAKTKAKVKYDRQIIAIAIERGADAIYTGDKSLAKCAKKNGIKVVMTWEIPLPPEDPQMTLALNNGQE